jgi:PadR family transcriptional regulator, regulatory protein AphA
MKASKYSNVEYCQAVPQKLTSTSYALLGLLNLRPFSAYELTKYMKRSALAELWPRTEASIYKEAKALEASTFATARVASTGARARTVYSITPAGRRALRAWLREPGGRLEFECEAAMKAFFGDATDLETLRVQLQVLASQPESSIPQTLEIFRDFRDSNVRFPERIHYTAMAADLISRINLAVVDWAESWLQHTESWSGTSLDGNSRAQADAVLGQLISELTQRQSLTQRR